MAGLFSSLISSAIGAIGAVASAVIRPVAALASAVVVGGANAVRNAVGFGLGVVAEGLNWARQATGLVLATGIGLAVGVVGALVAGRKGIQAGGRAFSWVNKSFLFGENFAVRHWYSKVAQNRVFGAWYLSQPNYAMNTFKAVTGFSDYRPTNGSPTVTEHYFSRLGKDFIAISSATNTTLAYAGGFVAGTVLMPVHFVANTVVSGFGAGFYNNGIGVALGNVFYGLGHTLTYPFRNAANSVGALRGDPNATQDFLGVMRRDNAKISHATWWNGANPPAPNQQAPGSVPQVGNASLQAPLLKNQSPPLLMSQRLAGGSTSAALQSIIDQTKANARRQAIQQNNNLNNNSGNQNQNNPPPIRNNNNSNQNNPPPNNGLNGNNNRGNQNNNSANNIPNPNIFHPSSLSLSANNNGLDEKKNHNRSNYYNHGLNGVGNNNNNQNNNYDKNNNINYNSNNFSGSNSNYNDGGSNNDSDDKYERKYGDNYINLNNGNLNNNNDINNSRPINYNINHNSLSNPNTLFNTPSVKPVAINPNKDDENDNKMDLEI